MNAPRVAPVTAVLAGLLATGLFAGCATRTRSFQTPADSRRVVAYDQVFITGSYIPVLVPRSPTARMDPTISPLDIITPEQLKQQMGPMH